jgi:hypothetical protein
VKHDRKNGNQQSQPICVWNGILEKKHRDRMGKRTALWLYLEMLDKITLEDSQGIGWLLGKKPIKLKDFEGNVQTNRRFFKTLKRFAYIVVRRTPYGYVIGVTNTLKLRFGRVGSSAQSGVSSSANSQRENEQFSTARVSSSAHYKEDNAVDNAKSSSLPLVSLWQQMGIDPERLQGRVRKLCEDLHCKRGNQSAIEFLSICMDAIQGMGWSIPPQIAQAKMKLRVNGNGHQREPIPELEPEPWGGAEAVRQ